MNKFGPALTIAIAIVLIVLITWRTGRSHRPLSTQPVGAAPAVGGTTLDGQRWHLQDQRGKVVLLDFWATWCPPCVASIPELKAIHEQFKSHPDFVLVGVSLDDSRKSLESFVQKRGLSWPQIFDLANRKEMARAFGVSAIPTVILIDRQGDYRIVNLESNLVAEIDRLLKSPA